MAATGIRFGGRVVNFGKTLVVAVTVVIVSVIVMLETPSQKVETISVHLTLNQLRAALVVKGAEVRLASGDDNYAAWRGLNPMSLLETSVRNYSGSCENDKPDTGRWCFDTKRHSGLLQYQPSQPIRVEKGGVERSGTLAWRVEPEYTDLNGNGRLDEADRQTGLKLVFQDSRNEPDHNGRP